MEQIDILAREWLVFKQAEEQARQNRVAIEEQMLELHSVKEEGSETLKTGAGYKIKFVSKLKYRCDIDMLRVITSDWPSEAQPFKVKTEADEAKLRAIRTTAPSVWAKIAPAITTEPAKVGVSIELEQ